MDVKRFVLHFANIVKDIKVFNQISALAFWPGYRNSLSDFEVDLQKNPVKFAKSDIFPLQTTITNG